MKAIVHSGKSEIEGLNYTDSAIRKPEDGEVKVKLKVAGLNRRDLFIINNKKGNDSSFIPGSDGAGLISETGGGVLNFPVGTEVIINPSIDWTYANTVPDNPKILGGPSDGTFAEYVIVPAENVVEKPSYLSWEEAGVLPLSALTAYRALFTKGQLKEGEHILIPGI